MLARCVNLVSFEAIGSRYLRTYNGGLISIDGRQMLAAPNRCTAYEILDLVQTVKTGAFRYCQGLTAVTFPASLTTIEAQAFTSCLTLTDVQLPDGLKTIGDFAFAGCAALTSVLIPKSVTSIGAGAFTGCTALTALDASSCALTALDLTGCTALKTVACSYNKLTALDVPAAEKLTTLECSANHLTALDLSGHKTLKVLTCSLNSLMKLDLTGCTALESLDCSDNALAALDLSGCTALNATAQGDGKTANPILSPQYLPEQTGAVTDGQQCTVYLDAIVGKDNIGSITAVKGASYDKETGIARYSAAVEKPSYTYATGSSAVSLTVSFSLDMSTLPKSPFTDVVAGSWYFDAALYASSHNLMLGTSPTEFSPNITMTRGMLVTVLYRMNGSPSVSGKTPFTDVRTDEWYSAAVLWAYQNGIVTGMSDTTFDPINNVTREQMATILFRYTKTAAPDKAKASADLSGFADAGSVNDWAVDAMRWAVGQKLIAGITLEQSVYLQPRGNATRAQAATVLTRYYAQ